MDLDLRGHPIHTRSLGVSVSQGDGDSVVANGYLLDLRKRGFCPVGSELQAMGIIHHMEVRVAVERASLTIASIGASQPTVAFEATPATIGESCRDPRAHIGRLTGARLDERFGAALRDSMAGPLGCSHVYVLLQFVAATLAWILRRDATPLPTEAAVGARLFRRDLILDGNDTGGSTLMIGLQLSDLYSAATTDMALPGVRFARHEEWRAALTLDGWPATVGAVDAAQRQRSRAGFAHAEWQALPLTEALVGLSLGKGGATQLQQRLATLPPLRDALLMLAPALIQCRAAFPDKWLSIAITTPNHPGLIGIADSCYMWRRGGALEQQRERLIGKN